MKRMVWIIALVALLLTAIVLPCLANDVLENYPHVKNGQIDQTGYFEVEGAEIALEEESVVFTMTAETAKITFEKPLAADGFSYAWNTKDDAAQRLQKMVVTITDIEDPECALQVNFEKVNETASSVKLNDEKFAYLTQGSFYKENERDIKITYSDTDKTIFDGDTMTIPVRKSASGDGFSGFKSMAVNMTVELTGKPGAVLCLKSLNGQRFGTEYQNDNVEPMLCLPQFSKKALYNSVFQLPKVAAYDVLANDVSMLLTVKNPDGEIMTDTEGTLLEGVDGRKDYKIKLDKFGSYFINYVLNDGLNQTLPMGYRLTVSDEGAPALVLSKTVDVLTVGQEYVFPEATITDNSNGECISWISVKHPDGTITCEVEKFVPKEVGIYSITYTAMDENGNITRLLVETYAKEDGK